MHYHQKYHTVLLTTCILLTGAFIIVPPVFAQSAEVAKIQTFIESIIQILTTLAGLVATVFFVWGGVGYITSTGNPEALDRSKKTILYSAIGLALVIGAFVISTIVTDLATAAFGSASAAQ